MGRIFLLRHGQTVANRDRILQGPRIDAELSDLGRRQADSLGMAFSGLPLEALYCSPLTRARETAAAIAQRHQRGGLKRSGLAVQVAPEIYEMDYGTLAGRTYDEISSEMEQVLDAWKMGFVDQSFPGGESPVLAQVRLRPFAHRIRTEAQEADVAVVAHGRINRILIATLTGAGLTRLEEFPQSNASITELAVTPEAVDIVRLNDVAHLSLATDALS
ncbi:MAG TPA: histidine phosphatase family protein [Candidatus Thermoplasmatota archaeon]|nr:histidine phosphatase family protein [Candidatus Thermoplasmatota archaeon]